MWSSSPSLTTISTLLLTCQAKSATLAAYISEEAATGEQLQVLTGTFDDAQDAVLQFLAVLAYPNISDEKKRDTLAEAIHAALYKARVWNERSKKHDSSALRTRVPAEFRKIKNRRIDGLVRRGLGRISHRIMAGNVALRFLLAGTIIPLSGSESSSTTELTSKPFHIPITVLRSSGPARPLKLVAPKTLRDAFLDVVKLKQQKEKIYLSEDDAMENFRKQVWVPSLPVLHLACTLYVETCRLPVAPADAIGEALESAGERRRREQSWEGAQFIWELTSDPSWIADALVRAEGYRNLLGDRIPQCDFNLDKAVRLLPL